MVWSGSPPPETSYLTIHHTSHPLHVVDHANEAEHVDSVDRVRRTMVVHVFGLG